MNSRKVTLTFYSLNLQLSVEQLLLVNAHLGHVRKFLSVKIKPYLIGQRANIYLINVLYTADQFRVFLNVLINLFCLRQKLLIVKDLVFFDFKSIMDNSNIYYYDKK